MSNWIKLAITLSAISMISGIFYMFIGALLISLGHISVFQFSMMPFAILWLGPIITAITIGTPITLYRMWRR